MGTMNLRIYKHLQRKLNGHFLHCFQFLLQPVALLCLLMLAAVAAHAATAVDPNKQAGECGPFYIWYQTGPDEFSSPTDYVDLHSITFDMSDIVDDFDFVYFTDSRRELDSDKDGVSDQHFSLTDGNVLKWIPANGRARITQPGCWSATFDKKCGYAMISIQPKPWYQNGSARIPVHVKKSCSPNNIDCSETHLVQHAYTDCEVRSLPDFIIRKKISDKPIIDGGRFVFEYTVTIENTTDELKDTTLKDSVTSITHGGQIYLDYFNIECPKNAICQIQEMNNERFAVELRDIPPHEDVIVSYHMTIARDSIPADQKSYFTNTAILSTGGSSQITIGMTGTGEGRIERPRD